MTQQRNLLIGQGKIVAREGRRLGRLRGLRICGLRFEIQGGEFSVVDFGGFVIGLCGFDFISEVSDGVGLAIGVDFDDPSFFAGVPGDTFVF
jgi:hypothetical protein